MIEPPVDFGAALQTLVESASVLTLGLDAEGRVVHANQHVLRVTGWSREELAGTSWLTVGVPEGERARIDAALRDLAAGRGPLHYESIVRARDGGERVVLWTSSPVRSARAEVVGSVSIGVDVTSQRQVELRLRSTLRELESQKFALDQHSIVAITDRSGAITYVNDKFSEISGYSREELLGKNHRILNSGHHPAEFFREMWRSISSGAVWRAEIKNRAKDGHCYWVDTTIVPFKDERGRIDQYVAIRTDITQRKRDAEQLARAARLAALGELAGNVAHEVNNPIGIIGAKARLLLTGKDELPAKVSRELGKMVEQCDRIGRLTRGLLDYCRPALEQKEPIDIHEPLAKATALVSTKAARQGIEVVQQLAEPPPIVNGSTNELQQVFLNLFLNAIDALPDGGRIELHTRTDERLADGGRAATIVIADTGTGVPEEVRGRIFEPFFTTKFGKGGTGLGLAICYGLVTGHGGDIRLESPPGQGARFVVRLPLIERPSRA